MKKLALIAGLTTILTSFSFATSLKLSTNQNQVNINNPITISLELKTDQGNIVLKEIKGLENFQIIGQRNYQSSSMSVEVINGKTTQKSVTTYTLILTLLAKKAGNYTIGPAIVSVNGKDYQSNTIQIKVTGTKIMINNTPNTFKQNSNQTNSIQTKNNLNQITNSSQASSLNNQNQEKIKIQNNSYNTAMFILAFTILLGISLLILAIKKSQEKTEEENINENNQEEKLTKTFQENNENLTNNTENINYQKDEFLEKIAQEYQIENIYTKTYSELLKELKEKNALSPELEKQITDYYFDKFKRKM